MLTHRVEISRPLRNVQKGHTLTVETHTACLRAASILLLPAWQFEYEASQPVIPSSYPLLNWRYWFAPNFFHFMTEALPSLIVGLIVTCGVEDLHVLASHNQVRRGMPTGFRV